MIFGAALGDVVGLATRWMTPDQVAFHYGRPTPRSLPGEQTGGAGDTGRGLVMIIMILIIVSI